MIKLVNEVIFSYNTYKKNLMHPMKNKINPIGKNAKTSTISK